jgi:hypothetical protein
MQHVRAFHLAAFPTMMGLAVLSRFLLRPQLLTRVSSPAIG